MRIRLRLLPDRYAVCRLGPDDGVPSWASGEVVSLTRTTDELSIVCREEDVPPAVRAERAWRCLMVEGPIPFETTGIAAVLTAPLAAAKISLFFLSTFDTDYLFIKELALMRAIDGLRDVGCVVLTE